MDFNFVTDRVATGAALNDEADVQTLVDAGISHIIDCNDSFNDGQLLASHPNITYLYNGTPDDGQPKSVSWFQRSLEFALPALALPKNKVYAHCKAGINRGPSTCFCILRAQGLTPLTARSFIEAARPITITGLRYADDADKAIDFLQYN